MEPNQNARYSRQMLFPPIGPSGQEKLSGSRVAIVGLGALGTVLANHMVRGGVGYLRCIDRDFVETSNLQRQMLYDEEDARNHMPKAVAAADKLKKMNSSVTIEPIVGDVHAYNAEELLSDVDIILDGTDNFQIRYLLNDVAVKHRIPWVYGGAVSSRGMFAAIRPYVTPCYRCLFPDPPAGRGETCDTVGVIGPIVHIVASYQAAEALKLMVGAEHHLNPYLEQFELWTNRHMQMDIRQGKHPDCPACGKGEFEFLYPAADSLEVFTALCGRDTVQITPRGGRSVNLEEEENVFRRIGKVERNPFLLRFHVGDYALVLFKDGRVLVQGTQDIDIAKSLYAKYISH
ncbi:thiazole biosynthesis adenylyltransferase ThiF [Paenibacillus sp. JMULE4]|uniref:ThiF family adenylyltransferase n=1 Tax=Paenibacillus sp. JMULE4 TaxID=2518342 RepID=UPI0015766E1F|nr:ThiF family adenylyltransferase [Paenibacillus sp. JMULE4]NTZ17405.1 thiazole biosynthesis adenylyltransferase ThiF [Paenibacillus sp. JMULE4]